jgi:chromosomal replication initiation ATPase DnaA
VTKPRQLALDLPSLAAQGREDFLVSPSNEAAYALVDAWPRWPGAGVMLVGPPGAGKSHLAAIWSAEAGGGSIEAGELAEADVPQALSRGALVVEDGDRGRIDEAALFHLLNLARETAVPLLVTARKPPDRWGLFTPDLLSRLRAMTLVEIGEPDEALLRAVLVKLFLDRQMVVDTSVVDHVARHIDRSFEAVRAVVAALDREALSRGRRITRALAGEVLRESGLGDTSDT